MKWNSTPHRVTRWDQGRKITRVEDGICMGISVLLCKSLIRANIKKKNQKITSDSVYEFIRGQLTRQREILTASRKLQNTWSDAEVPKRTSETQVLASNRLYLLGLNFSLKGGYLTHMSLWSYLFHSGVVNHAALLYLDGTSVVVFEPNWGVGQWATSSVGQCDIRTVENLLEGGYHDPADEYKYAVELLEVGNVKLGKKPTTNMNANMLR